MLSSLLLLLLRLLSSWLLLLLLLRGRRSWLVRDIVSRSLNSTVAAARCRSGLSAQ